MHGGASTGPRTPEGLEKCRRTNWKSGFYSGEAKLARQAFRYGLRALRLELKERERELKAFLRDRRLDALQLAGSPYEWETRQAREQNDA